MFCDNCQERDAVVQLTQVLEDGPVTVHLCEKCAAERGIEPPVSSAPKHPLVDFLAAQKKVALAPTDGGRCPFCSLTLRDFRASGRLGCARCYATFEATLRELLRNVHGNSRHAGKRYTPPLTAATEAMSMMTELQDRLRRAIDSEQFELAAKLRDQIKVLE